MGAADYQSMSYDSNVALCYSHEDGSVRFWDASSSCLQFLYKLNTSTIFNVDVHTPDSNGEMEEEWPPFRKVG